MYEGGTVAVQWNGGSDTEQLMITD